MFRPRDRTTLETVVENDDTRFGFTQVHVDGKHLIRTPDDQFKEVPKVVIETLKDDSTDTSIESLIAETAERDSEAAAVLREMHEEGYIREGAPVERVQPPADIRIWPRALGVGVLLCLAGVLVVRTVLALAEPVVENPIRYLLGTAHVSVPLILGSVAAHEYGHHRTARKQGLDPEFGVSVINGVIPAVVTRTHAGWCLPRNRRMWNTLAGPAYGLLWTVAVFGLYFTVVPHPGIAVAGVMCFNLQFAALLPIFHGDGYLLLTDLFDARNLRTRGIADLKRGRPTWAAAYVVASYGLVIGQFVVNLVIGYFVGDLLGVGVVLLLAVAIYVGRYLGILERLRALASPFGT